MKRNLHVFKKRPICNDLLTSAPALQAGVLRALHETVQLEVATLKEHLLQLESAAPNVSVHDPAVESIPDGGDVTVITHVMTPPLPSETRVSSSPSVTAAHATGKNSEKLAHF